MSIFSRKNKGIIEPKIEERDFVPNKIVQGPAWSAEERKMFGAIDDKMKQVLLGSTGAVVFISRLHLDGEEEKLEHSMFIVNYKDDDLSIAVQEFNGLATEHQLKRKKQQKEMEDLSKKSEDKIQNDNVQSNY